MKKLFVSLMAAVMLISSIGLVSLAADETNVYKASDAWDDTLEDGTTDKEYNGHTEWKWERNDSGTGWVEFAKFRKSINPFGMIPPDVTGDNRKMPGSAWTTNSFNFGHPAVSKGWMTPYRQTNPKNAVSKTFIAPMSGIVELSTEDGNIYGGSDNPKADNCRPAFIRITVNDEQIWPADGYEMRMPDDNEQIYEFNSITTEINKYDKLRFEVYSGDDTYQDGKYVYWKPVVSYKTTVTNTEYESDAAWAENLTADTMKNQDAVWKWLYKNNSTTNTENPYVAYTLTAQNSTGLFNKPILGTDGKYDYVTNPTAITRVYCDSTSNAYMRNAMGRWWMRLSVASTSEPKQSTNNEIVKEFTAPETGDIYITAKDLSDDSKIYNKKLTATNSKGAVLKIIKKCLDGSDKQLWSYTFEYSANTVSTSGLAEYNFKLLKTNIQKGEKLWFVVSGKSGGSAYAKQVFWNPVVTYLEDPSEPVDVTFTEQAEYRYEGTNEAGEDEGSVRFLAMPEAADGSAAADIEQYGYWFVNADNLEIKSDIHDNNEGDEKLELGDTFYYTANNMNIKNAASVGFYAIPWVKISGRVSAGNAFTYTGELSKEKGKVIKSNPADN